MYRIRLDYSRYHGKDIPAHPFYVLEDGDFGMSDSRIKDLGCKVKNFKTIAAAEEYLKKWMLIDPRRIGTNLWFDGIELENPHAAKNGYIRYKIIKVPVRDAW